MRTRSRRRDFIAGKSLTPPPQRTATSPAPVEPKTTEKQGLVFATSSPRAGQHLAANHTLKVALKIVRHAGRHAKKR